MVSAHDPGPDQAPTIKVTNKVIKTLSTHGTAFKTFGENIILLLNRESRLSPCACQTRVTPLTKASSSQVKRLSSY